MEGYAGYCKCILLSIFWMTQEDEAPVKILFCYSLCNTISRASRILCKLGELQTSVFSTGVPQGMAQSMAATCFNGCTLLQVHWLLQLSGIACTAQPHQKDPHALCKIVIEDLQRAGFIEPGIPSSDLEAGWGNAVISVLNSLADLALKSQRFNWTQPLRPPEMYARIDIIRCKSTCKP